MPFERVRQAKRRLASSVPTSVSKVTQAQPLAGVPHSNHHFGNFPIEPPATSMSTPIQTKPIAGDQAATATRHHPNDTGMPDHLKTGIENLSGFSLDKVRVHYNSDKPAKLQALAYTQGTDIHVAPGQERHLAHEAWHVVQQAQGRVRPTMQMKSGEQVNDDDGLEREAGAMGLQARQRTGAISLPKLYSVSRPSGQSSTGTIIQRYIDEATGHENNIPPVGVRLYWDVFGQRWLDETKQPWTGVQPPALPLPTFSIGVHTPPTKEQQRQRRNAQKKEREAERRAAHAEYQKGIFAVAKDRSDWTIPAEAKPIQIDPYGLEQEVNQRSANQYKAQPLGVKATLLGTRIRGRDISFLSEDIVMALIDHAKWFTAKNLIWAEANGANPFIATLDTDDRAKVERALCIKYLILNEEAQPRSGAGRAAPDDQIDKLRVPAKDEAGYSAPSAIGFHHKSPGDMPTFKAEHKGKMIVAKVTHTGPWSKGIRDPGQSQVMGGQNAKNYIVDQKLPHEKDWLRKQTYKDKQLGGRWEWLHLVGSSLGGPNTANNLVAGSYDANTKMIALEHRVANWGMFNYFGEFRPTKANPISIETQATVNPQGSHVGDTIHTTVRHGNHTVVEGDYMASDQKVITKAQYAAEEKRVESSIEQARPKIQKSQ